MSEPTPLWIQIAPWAGALATFIAALVALFGDWIRGRWFRPKLELTLEVPLGVAQRVTIGSPDGSSREEDARFYGLKVRNKNRWPVATQVQVYLLRIEEPRSDGQLAKIWGVDIPLRWQHQEIAPLARSIGQEAAVDLLHVVAHKWVAMSPLVLPIGFPMQQRNTAFSKIVLSVQARSAEADSEVVRVEVSWNGKWAPGEAEMANNLVVKMLPGPTSS